MSRSPPWSDQGRYLMLVVAVLVVAVAGYVGYVVYPRFDLPAAEGLGLLGLAAAAGFASFFSPCSFPLLVTLLARQAVDDAEAGRPSRPAMFGGALALGAGVFMLLAGVAIGLGGEALFAGVTFTSAAGITVRVVVGVLLVFLGLVQLGVIGLSMHVVSRLVLPLLRSQARLRRERPVAGFAVFGFAYVLAGFGWTGPILAGLASYSLTVGGFEGALLAFVAASLVLVGLVFAAAFGVARAQDETVERIKARAPRVRRWGGWILVAVGVWFLALAVLADFFSEVFPV